MRVSGSYQHRVRMSGLIIQVLQALPLIKRIAGPDNKLWSCRRNHKEQQLQKTNKIVQTSKVTLASVGPVCLLTVLFKRFDLVVLLPQCNVIYVDLIFHTTYGMFNFESSPTIINIL